MLRGVMLSFIVQNDTMLGVVGPSVIMLRIVKLSIVKVSVVMECC